MRWQAYHSARLIGKVVRFQHGGTPLPKAAKPVWATQLTQLPCLMVYVKSQFVYITHSLLKFPMASTVAHPTRKGLCGHDYRFHQQRFCIRPSSIRLHQSGCSFSGQPAGWDRQRILSRHYWMPTGSPCSLTCPSNPNPPIAHSLNTHQPM